MKLSKRIKYLLAGLILTSGLTANAQQTPLYTMYMWNPLVVNPAYAGARDALTVTGVWREQWVGLEGAPSTQALSVHGPLTNDKIGLGFTAQNDNVGPSNTTTLFGDFAYRMKAGAHSKLSLALRAGFGIHQADLRSLEGVDDNDPAFDNNVESNLIPNFGFGAWYEGKRGYVGLSSPTLLENELNSANNTGSNAEDLMNRHYYLMAGYVFNLSGDSAGVMFKPSILVRAVNGSPISFDFSANFLIMDKLWLGAAYRYEDSFAGIVSFQFTDHLQAGYSYDFGTSDLRSYQQGSHEVMLTYDFFKTEIKTRSPRYF